jgi:hypothetical protein
MKTAKAKRQPLRLARRSDRDHAAELARRYREKDPYRVEVSSGRVVELYVDGDWLADSLASFAERGTWDEPAEHRAVFRDLRRDSYRRVFAQLRATGKISALDAIARIAEIWEVSDQTVSDAVYRKRQ